MQERLLIYLIISMLKKKYGNNNADYSLLPKGSQKFLFSYNNNINAAY